jgi:hypothetical protein
MKFSVTEWLAIYSALKASAKEMDEQDPADGYNMIANDVRRELEARGYRKIMEEIQAAKDETELGEITKRHGIE